MRDQNINSTSIPYELMVKGEYDAAYLYMTEEMRRDPASVKRHLYNRGNCLLLLNKPEKALMDFVKFVELRPASAAGYISAGIAYWLSDRVSEAVENWTNATNSTFYADAAGGVEAPALLFFASTIMSDSNLEANSIKLLSQRWITKRATVWPGPIAGYLLGKINQTDLYKIVKGRGPIIEKRMLTKIHFWIGLKSFRENNLQDYRNYMKLTMDGHFIEYEYFLAKHEFARLIS